MHAPLEQKTSERVILIKLGYDITFGLPTATTIVYVLHIHPSRTADLVTPESFRIEPSLPVEEYFDGFGNRCGRVNAPPGNIRLLNEAVIRDSGELDPCVPTERQNDVTSLPLETLAFVLPSRYCEVDSELLDFAWSTFASTPPGWQRVQAVCDFVHGHIRFDYMRARANRTALEAFHERVGVCRDFTHLAITLCRCLNFPARYVTGYLGDIGVTPSPDPMDFSAWFEVFLGKHWYTFDARHNTRRIGRVVIGRGRDAGDVPITMAFGRHTLVHFQVTTEQIDVAKP
ncbi:MAG TPA: transglutaminase family protein [Chthoniobacterales bacterium]|nr:transglutaminase family protein [Chthoniobacterales bacterium]